MSQPIHLCWSRLIDVKPQDGHAGDTDFEGRRSNSRRPGLAPLACDGDGRLLGDIVEVLPETTKGRVIDRNLMFVILREQGGNLVQIPNSLLFQKIVKVSGNNDRSLFEALEAKAVPIAHDPQLTDAPPPPSAGE